MLNAKMTYASKFSIKSFIDYYKKGEGIREMQQAILIMTKKKYMISSIALLLTLCFDSKQATRNKLHQFHRSTE